MKMNFEASTHYGDPTYDSSSSSDLVIDTSSSSSSSSNSSSSPAPKTADSVPEFKAMIHSLLTFTVLNPDT